MLYPPIRNLGVKGIKRLGEEIDKFSSYPKFTFDQETVSVFRYLYIYFEEAGTGGSCFRNIYRDFLKESMGYVDSENLVRGYEEYSKAAEVWGEISELLLEIDRGKTEKLQEVKRKVI